MLGRHELAAGWLRIWADLGRAPRTIDAYARGLTDTSRCASGKDVDPVTANRAHVAGLRPRAHDQAGPSRGQRRLDRLRLGAGERHHPARLVPVRLFYDHLIEEGLREFNPVGRGKYTPGRRFGGRTRPGPAADQAAVDPESGSGWTCWPCPPRSRSATGSCWRWPMTRRFAVRNCARCRPKTWIRGTARCGCRRTDQEPAGTRGAVLGGTGVLLASYLAHRATISRARGPLFLSESHRNHGRPLSLWTWSKVVRRIADEAGVPRFSTHTTRHLCLTDLARMGWELHAISTFAGHGPPIDSSLHPPVRPGPVRQAQPDHGAHPRLASGHADPARRTGGGSNHA